MITTDNLIKVEEPKPEPEAAWDGPMKFVLYENGPGSRVLGVGKDYSSMWNNAAVKTGMTAPELRSGGYKFVVEPDLSGSGAPTGTDSSDPPAQSPQQLRMAHARAVMLANRAKKAAQA